MIRTILTLMCTLSLTGWMASGAAQSISKGKEKAAICAGCHGEAGKGASPLFPKLAGQNVKYLKKQLRYFKEQTRVIPAMNAIVATLSDEDMVEVSLYYSQQQPSVEAEESSPEGERIYRSGITTKKVPACSACHGPDGEGNVPAGFPLIKGQYAAYTVKALSDYAAGVRGEAKAPMRDIAARMTEQEMKDVAAYIAALP